MKSPIFKVIRARNQRENQFICLLEVNKEGKEVDNNIRIFRLN